MEGLRRLTEGLRRLAEAADRRCLWRVEFLEIEGLGFLKPFLSGVVASGGANSLTIEGLGSLLRGAVASGGSKSSKNEGLAFFRPLLSGVVASGGSESSKIEVLEFTEAYGRFTEAHGRFTKLMKGL